MQNRIDPNQAIYTEFQRVAASNRFIFTHGPITFAIGLIIGPLGIVAYIGAWGVLMFLAQAFERPYRLLRKLLPYGNWPALVVPVASSWKGRMIIAAASLIVVFATSLWFTYRVMFPVMGIHDSVFNEMCIGLVCLLFR